MGNSTGNGHSRVPLEILDRNYPEIIDLPPPRMRARRRPLWPAIVFFCSTLLMTLSAGALIVTSFAQNLEPFSGNEGLFAIPLLALQHPGMLLLGIPFSLTLLGFFMAHEMGHYLACNYYGIDCSYPFLLPSPFLFGTFGAGVIKNSRANPPRAARSSISAFPADHGGFIVVVPTLAYGNRHVASRSRRAR